jgi:hypothetical protein
MEQSLDWRGPGASSRGCRFPFVEGSVLVVASDPRWTEPYAAASGAWLRFLDGGGDRVRWPGWSLRAKLPVNVVGASEFQEVRWVKRMWQLPGHPHR